MSKFESSQAALQSSAQQLSELFNLDSTTRGTFNEADLPSMLEHQFRASMNVEPGFLKRMKSAKATPCATPKEKKISTFGELLFNPSPPIELLKYSKDLFKAKTKNYKKESPEWRLAYLFYVLSIVAAGEHWSRVTTLSLADLLTATDWASKQEWLNDRTKALVSKARGLVATPPK